jgi:sucrose-phosphate synthase
VIIIHLALGGCLKAPPVHFGVTADTGGHIAYVLDAATHQALRADVDEVLIVTRAFVDTRLDPVHAQLEEAVAPTVSIRRLATSDRRYLEKEALAAELPALTDAFCDMLMRMERLPDVIHAHFADAAAVAMAAQRRFGIPFVYTPHALGIDKRTQRIECPGLDARIASERAAIVGASAIVVSTGEEALRQIGGYGVDLGDRVTVIAPGVPRRGRMAGPNTLAERLGDWLDRPELPIILAIARPVAKKNLTALAHAYAADPALRAQARRWTSCTRSLPRRVCAVGLPCRLITMPMTSPRCMRGRREGASSSTPRCTSRSA